MAAYSRQSWKLEDGSNTALVADIVSGCVNHLQSNQSQKWTPNNFQPQSRVDEIIIFLCKLLDHNGSRLNAMKIQESANNMEGKEKHNLIEVLTQSYSKITEVVEGL